MMWLFLRCLYIFAVSSAIRVLIPKTSDTAVRDVLRRLPAWISEEFPSIVIGEMGELTDDQVEITVDTKGRKTVVATSRTAALYGINNYLRSFCFTQIAWDNSSFGAGCLPQFDLSLTFQAPRIRYFGNPCTFSYSFAWWKWQDWERMIDWLALNGFNMVLAPVGQEAIWRDLFVEMGVARKQLETYFTGPAYLAWHRMGNLQSWGGPLSDSFMDSQLSLNRQIVARLVELGIVPVLPTFAGFVPEAVATLRPESKFIRNSCWNNFNESHSCLLSVHPNSPLFPQIAKGFYEKQLDAYGSVTHVYSADPLNELSTGKEDIRLLKETSKAVYKGCADSDPQCVWVLQSWTFSYDKWSNKAVKSFLSGAPIGGLLVLDLYAEHRPLWRELQEFYGHHFVWCLLHNFGGTTEMRGNIRHINKAYQLALHSSTGLMGAGLSMEAIGQNYVIYQFMADRMWTDQQITLHNWLESYVSSRYNVMSTAAVKAWSLVLQTFYSEPVQKTESHRFSVFIYGRPQFEQRIKYWFESSFLSTMVAQFSQLKEALWDNELFRIDYNDIVREKLQYDLGNRVVLRIYEGYGIGDNDVIIGACEHVQRMFEKIEEHTNSDMKSYEESARALASSPSEADQFSQNARDLVTTWGPKGQNIDYSRREWSGLISSYYARRWSFFCEWIVSNEQFNRTQYDHSILNYVERPYVTT